MRLDFLWIAIPVIAGIASGIMVGWSAYKLECHNQALQLFLGWLVIVGLSVVVGAIVFCVVFVGVLNIGGLLSEWRQIRKQLRARRDYVSKG